MPALTRVSSGLPALLRGLCCLLLCLLLGACASKRSEPAPVLRSGPVPDLSGHWEKDFGSSDDFANKVSLYAASVRSQLAPQRSDFNGNVRGSGVNVSAINGLLRFTEELTRSIILDIEQDEGRIIIEREEDFPLRCHFDKHVSVASSNAFGRERCGWQGPRFFMQMMLADGLLIDYQFTLSPDRERLHVMTSVSSDLASIPLVISNVYERYTPPEDNVECVLTLTRSRVCRQMEPR